MTKDNIEELFPNLTIVGHTNTLGGWSGCDEYLDPYYDIIEANKSLVGNPFYLVGNKNTINQLWKLGYDGVPYYQSIVKLIYSLTFSRIIKPYQIEIVLPYVIRRLDESTGNRVLLVSDKDFAVVINTERDFH